MGTRVSGKAFDIVTPACMEDFTLQDWFATSSGELPHGPLVLINRAAVGCCSLMGLLMPASSSAVVAVGEQRLAP